MPTNFGSKKEVQVGNASQNLWIGNVEFKAKFPHTYVLAFFFTLAFFLRELQLSSAHATRRMQVWIICKNILLCTWNNLALTYPCILFPALLMTTSVKWRECVGARYVIVQFKQNFRFKQDLCSSQHCNTQRVLWTCLNYVVSHAPFLIHHSFWKRGSSLKSHLK